jgi:hypothetical protein
LLPGGTIGCLNLTQSEYNSSDKDSRGLRRLRGSRSTQRSDASLSFASCSGRRRDRPRSRAPVTPNESATVILN